MAGTIPFKPQRRGDTVKQKKFEVIKNGAARDLTNVAIKVEFKIGKKTGFIHKTISVGNGITITDALAGKFAWNKFIADFPVGDIYFDIQFTENGDVDTWGEGVWKITQDTTDSNG